MPKKKSKGKKGGKPSWMSDELFALSQDAAGLLEAFRGTSDKGDKGDKTSPINVATKEQVRACKCSTSLDGRNRHNTACAG